jgi:hypothetical protein
MSSIIIAKCIKKSLAMTSSSRVQPVYSSAVAYTAIIQLERLDGLRDYRKLTIAFGITPSNVELNKKVMSIYYVTSEWSGRKSRLAVEIAPPTVTDCSIHQGCMNCRVRIMKCVWPNTSSRR